MTVIYFISIIICSFYLGIIILLSFGWLNLKESSALTVIPTLKVSVIIPFRNEEQNLEALLQSIALIDYPKDLIEILFVNDNSEDSGSFIIEKFLLTASFPVRLLHSPESGKKQAISFGIALAKGEIILCTDADCRVQPEWIRQIVVTFEDQNIKMALGPVAISSENKPWNVFQKIEFSSLIISSAGAVSINKPIMANGANLAYRKKDFIEVGGYHGNENIASGDDVFLMTKFLKYFGNKSITFVKSKQAIVNTVAQSTLKDYFNQRIRWASKSASYGSTFSKLTAITVLGINFIVVFLLLLSPFFSGFAHLFVQIWIFKTLLDIPLLVSGSVFFNHQKLIPFLPFIEIMTAILTVIPGFLSFLISPVWKNRKIT